MSYRAAASLQGAVFTCLSGWEALAGYAVLDAVPHGGGSGTFVLIGPETAVERADVSGGGAEHRLQISVISDVPGFLEAKRVAGEICAALAAAELALATGHLAGIWFERATARRLEEGAVRRIDLIFHARTEV
jgi:hypothetical protein